MVNELRGILAHAEIVTEFVWVTDAVATVNVVVVEPLGTVTLVGTDATHRY